MNFTYKIGHQERFVGLSGMPKSRVSMLVMSPEIPQLCESIRKKGITIVHTHPNHILPRAVQFHPDMLFCYAGNGRVILPESEKTLQKKLMHFDVQTIRTRYCLENRYPKDARCNVLPIGNRIFYNPKSADPEVLRCFSGCEHYTTTQGYTRCSVAIVNQNSVMTADRGLSKVMQQAGLEVLELEPGYIELPGYEYGFIGGCCGLIAPNLLAFTGSLQTHPDGKQIQQFLESRNVDFVELSEKPLRDIGGLIPLKEFVE